jgi:hypothetical protein
MKRAKSLTQNLQDAHAEFLADRHELEQIVNAPAALARPRLGALLRSARHHLTKHMAFKEQNGYLSPVLGCGAGTQDRARQFLEEQRQLLECLDALIRETQEESTAEDPLRERIQRWLSCVQEHETLENQFFDEARQDYSC